MLSRKSAGLQLNKKGAEAKPELRERLSPVQNHLFEQSPALFLKLQRPTFMHQSLSKLIVILIASFALLACATGTMFENKLEVEGAKRMNAEQVRAHLSGNTQKWINGGAYFYPNGTVSVKYAGKVYPKRTWTVDDDGKVCIVLPDGYVTSCSAYFDKNGEVWVVNLEIFGEVQQTEGGIDTVLKGNRLAEI